MHAKSINALREPRPALLQGRGTDAIQEHVVWAEEIRQVAPRKQVRPGVQRNPRRHIAWVGHEGYAVALDG
ncbi:MAG: hypothetical protein K9J37_07915 [Saprospiraceae bacterium]|nr:hypothetical protein [Saprospiraceae bacterium]MCF8249824.1 hypothetical protein [Saprospiraceae bacterium]MCF8279506.1 hypothetical protein [Bacteroidales bacterium]MCF8311742.1 hypothetical protein [Saprospiraceae bacterium]MCF8440309.1 hypothetical protein [Saprospiraceae bacterium]